MNQENVDRYLVLSDMHFGEKDSTTKQNPILDAIVEQIVKQGPWKQIIFTGDLLDLNLSTFTGSIEGKNGFRAFLERVEKRAAQEQVKFEDLVGEYIYIPGNHDYKIWDLLSTEVACTEVLAQGQQMNTVVPTPLKDRKWTQGSAFIAGIFPAPVRSRVTVIYPDHEIAGPDWNMVLTHGHYLTPIQTRGNDLSRVLKNPCNLKDAVDDIFKETAQYQTVANMLTFTKRTRKLSDELFGPSNPLSKIKGLAERAVQFLLGKLIRPEKLSPDPINDQHLLNIEYYLKYYRGYTSLPQYFVFGHTHDQDKSSTSRLHGKSILGGHTIEVFNAGAFLKARGVLATFLIIEVKKSGPPEVLPMGIDHGGVVKQMDWPPPY